MLSRLLKVVGLVVLTLLALILIVLILTRASGKSLSDMVLYQAKSPQHAYNIEASDISISNTGYAGLAMGGTGLAEHLAQTVSSLVSAPQAVPAPAYDNARAVKTTSDIGNVTERMVIKTADLSVVVKDVYDAVKVVTDYAVGNGGFVVSSNIYKNGLSPYGEVTIRVPSNKFDQGINEIKAAGEVKSESVNGQDITEQYVDLSAQLKNLQAVEKQYLEILAKAQKITDILEVQRQLTQVRGDIERLQGQMKYLKQNVDLSAITVHLSPNPENLPTLDEQAKWKPLAVFKDAIRSLVDAGKTLVNLVIWLVVFIPVWLVIGLVVWIVYRLVRRARRVNL